MKPEPESKEREVDRVDYLLERKKMGKFIYSNFQAVKNVGVSPYTKTKPIRQELGDYEHIAFTALRIFSLLYLSPVFAYELYKLGKIVGYCTIDGLLKTLRIKSLANSLAKTRILSRVFQNKRIHEGVENGWRIVGGAILELTEINKEKGILRYGMRENSCSIIKALSDRYHYKSLTKPCNCMQMGILSGQIEALFGGVWDGVETKCIAKGDPYCEMELWSHEEEIPFQLAILTKEEYGRILDMTIELVVSHDNTGRGELGDLVTMSISQSINYLSLSTSKGHVVLSNYAGKKVGEGLIKKVGKNNLSDVLAYLQNLFLDLKIGVIEYELNPEIIVIKVRESIYSSGVRNINMKLCIFLAGIMEGAFTEATNVEWLVTETKCIANGDSCCVFECVTRDPGVLGKLLLGE